MTFPWTDVLAAVTPLAVLIYLMGKRPNMPAPRALPLAAVLLYLVTLIWFARPADLTHAAVIDGLLTAWTPILIVAGAICLFQTMEACGAMDTLRTWLNGVSADRVAQLMIVAWAFQFLVEGASGFGTPPALAAPILVGLGVAPVKAAIVCLMLNTVPVSFGAVGTPIWFGFGQLDLSESELGAIAIRTALMQLAAAAVVPLIALGVVVDWTTLRRRLGFVYLSILSCMVPYVLLAIVDDEFPSVAGGLIGLGLTVALARYRVGLPRGEATGEATGEANGDEGTEAGESGPRDAEAGEPAPTRQPTPAPSLGRLVLALFPLWGTVVVLLITRIEQLGIKPLLNATEPMATLALGTLGRLGVSASGVVQLREILGTATDWSHALLYVPSFLPFGLIVLITLALYRPAWSDVKSIGATTLGRMKSPTIALLGALVFVRLFMMGEDRSAATILGTTLAETTGQAYPYLAVFLGALGSFFTGSATISNLTFGPIQDTIAAELGVSRTTILALQSVGGAMGNMVCIHNIVAVCSVLGLHQQEGAILRRTALALLAYGAAASAVGAVMLLLAG